MNANGEASLSLDLDNLWSYLKVAGDDSWERLPSYFDVAVPRFLDFFKQRNLEITVFVVGQDAVLPHNAPWLRVIGDSGHELGNHSFDHEPWIVSASFDDARREIARAHEAIAEASGQQPVGFRGPGFASSSALRRALVHEGYRYDASRLPTFIGPLARSYYFRSARMNGAARRKRAGLFGSWQEGFSPNHARAVSYAGRTIVDIPVTTMPITRLPIHCSYLHYLNAISPAIADRYFEISLRLCKVTGTMPSLLLHPLDFLGRDDAPALRFFPVMDKNHEEKVCATARFVDAFAAQYDVIPLRRHASSVADLLGASA
ncbi:MAG: polysaccharide deacetylase family protein [Candidatus Eremiobacteraeota bacterium]|nr:polysaccharide deacetylase family protein [Candidatus Eremiobacteraeota bacterium]